MPTNSSKSSEGLRKRPWCSVGFVTCCEFADVPSTCWFLARITRQTLATDQPNLKFGDTMKVHFICESRIVSVDHAPVFQLKIPAGTLRVFLQNSSLWHFGGNDWNGLSSHHEFGKASELASQISIPARLTNRRRSFQPSGRRCPKMSAGGKVNFRETHGWSCWYLHLWHQRDPGSADWLQMIRSRHDIDQFPPSGRLRRMQRKLKKLPCRCSFCTIQPTKPNAVLINGINYQLKYDTWVVLICKIVEVGGSMLRARLRKPRRPRRPRRPREPLRAAVLLLRRSLAAKGEVRRTPNNWQHTVSGEIGGNPKKKRWSWNQRTVLTNMSRLYIWTTLVSAKKTASLTVDTPIDATFLSS